MSWFKFGKQEDNTAQQEADDAAELERIIAKANANANLLRDPEDTQIQVAELTTDDLNEEDLAAMMKMSMDSETEKQTEQLRRRHIK